jgi:hypothetical protein
MKGGTADASLNSMEHTISERVFDTLPKQRRHHLYRHNGEIHSRGQRMNGPPSLAAHA